MLQIVSVRRQDIINMWLAFVANLRLLGVRVLLTARHVMSMELSAMVMPFVFAAEMVSAMNMGFTPAMDSYVKVASLQRSLQG